MARRRSSSSRRKKKSRLLVWLSIVVVLILAVSFSFDTFVKWQVEKYATAALKVDVTMSGLTILPFAGHVTVRGLKIGNPPGFSDPKLLSVGSIDVQLENASIFSPTLEIKEIKLDDTELYYEIKPKGSNFQTFLNNVDKGEPKGKAASSNRKVIVHEMLITNAKVFPSINLQIEKRGAKLDIADIRLHNLGGEDKVMSPADATQLVVQTLLKNITQQLPSNMIEQGVGTVKKGLKDIGKGILGN
jgi:uncharacterized protein involved in outer membrane biogenesis